MDISTTKQKFAKFGRDLALLLNRGLMYQKSHPMVKNSINEVHRSAQRLFETLSPIVFILNRSQFYVDEELLDPRINIKRIADLFKKNGIQSVSFERGLSTGELDIFIDIFSSLTTITDAESVKKALSSKGVYNVKVNHVLYKKVTEDDQIVSREVLKDVTPHLDDDDREGRKKFMDTLLESVLTEEFARTLSIQSLISNPSALSKHMIEADLASADRTLADIDANQTTQEFETHGDVEDLGDGPDGQGTGPGEGGQGTGAGGLGPGKGSGGRGSGTGSGGNNLAKSLETDAAYNAANLSETGAADSPAPGHGPMLMHQLDRMHLEVEKYLQGQSDVSLDELANAIFEMKKALFEGIETQKTLGVAYTNESQIIQKVNQLTDKVILGLIKDEYLANKEMPVKRLALIITRLVPEAKDLKRLLPQIKQALVNEGMPLASYLDLIQELKNELQNDELARVLQESADTIGVDNQTLINEIKENPTQAAKLIYLASEIKKGTGDEAALSDILVDYVEQMALDAAEGNSDKSEAQLEKVVTNVESTIMKQLGKMDVDSDVLLKMEDRINERMESILDKMRVEWLESHATAKKVEGRSLSVLQTLEHHVGDDEELGEILKTIRSKVEYGDIDENNFSQIQSEITREKERIKAQAENIELPEGVLKPDELIYVLDKEIARSKRYNAPFSTLAFSFVKAKPAMNSLEKVITAEGVMAAALEKLTLIIREADYIGQIGKNKMVAILPMIAKSEAKSALGRILSTLHNKPLKVHGVPVNLRVAGVFATYDDEQKLDSHAFAKQLSNQLMDMVARVKNIQVLF